jgi:hypothetical protein
MTNEDLPEQIENIHALIQAGRYKEACDMFEIWFNEQIGNA